MPQHHVSPIQPPRPAPAESDQVRRADPVPAPAAPEQPNMYRHLPPSPAAGDRDPSAAQLRELLRTVERQNALLTELLAAVNGLTALLCSKLAR